MSSLALDALEVDNAFLRRGGSFSEELLEQRMRLKQQEIGSIGTMPHPFEGKLHCKLAEIPGRAPAHRSNRSPTERRRTFCSDSASR